MNSEIAFSGLGALSIFSIAGRARDTELGICTRYWCAPACSGTNASRLVGTHGVHGQAQSGPCGRGFEAARMPPESARQDGVLSRSSMLGGGRETGPQHV